METLDSKFLEMKSFHFSSKQITKGYFTIIRILKPTIYLKIIWELITTFVVFSPSINNYTQDLISSIREKWNTFSEDEQNCVIAALSRLNKHGNIEKALNKYK